MTNMAARLDLIDAVKAIPVTISESFDDSLNYLVVNPKNEDLEVGSLLNQAVRSIKLTFNIIFSFPSFLTFLFLRREC